MIHFRAKKHVVVDKKKTNERISHEKVGRKRRKDDSSTHAVKKQAVEGEKRIRKIAIIAEGVPERETRMLIDESRKAGVLIIGPATVGGVFPGRFKIGNTGGMLSNQIASKLYRPGSVSYVSRSGGLSNELNNIISKVTDGVRSGVAIGGDRYPISTFIDHMLKFEADPHTKILILLGEVGGSLEYEVIRAIKDGRIRKPVVAWCTGTVAASFTYDVQFGHAGALAGSNLETAHAKNDALRDAGCFVPNSFQEFGHVLQAVYKAMVSRKILSPVAEVQPPKVPVDYNWAQKIGMVRKSKLFWSSQLITALPSAERTIQL